MKAPLLTTITCGFGGGALTAATLSLPLSFRAIPPPNTHLTRITTACFPVVSLSCFCFGVHVSTAAFSRTCSGFTFPILLGDVHGGVDRTERHRLAYHFSWVSFTRITRASAVPQCGYYRHDISFSRHTDDSFPLWILCIRWTVGESQGMGVQGPSGVRWCGKSGQGYFGKAWHGLFCFQGFWLLLAFAVENSNTN